MEKQRTRARVFPVIAILVIVLVLLAVVLLLWPRPGTEWRGATSGDPHDWNVLLISLDTTRPDRLAACGGTPVATPGLDRVLGGGVRFEQMVSPAPITLPAHASLFTGVNPYRHGVRENTEYMLPPTAATLAEAYRRAGYVTAAFVASFVLDRRFGLDRGFDLYVDRLAAPGTRPVVELPAEEMARRFTQWMAGYAQEVRQRPSGRRPFFLFLHFYDAHAPYRPPSGFEDPDPYNGELAYQDHALGRVLDALEASGEAARTLIWVVSDHGESLGDHGEATHSLFIYDAAVRVVSILRAPPRDGRLRAGSPRLMLPAQTSLIDVAPTLLEICGITGLSDPEGISLLPQLEGSPDPQRTVYLETLSPAVSYHWAPLYGLRSRLYKYIRAPQAELYDLKDDPGETMNLFATEAERAAVFDAELDAILTAAPGDAAAQRVLTPEERERLRSLGYIAGGAGETSSVGRDPKEMIAFFHQQFQQAKNLLYARRFDEAAAALEQAARIDPLNNTIYFNLGTALRHAGDPRRAGAAYREALRIEPRSSRAWIGWGKALAALEEPDSALWAFQQAVAILPAAPDAYIEIGDQHWRTGRFGDAAAAYGAALDRGGDPLRLHGLLARLYREALADPARAEQHLRAFAQILNLPPERAAEQLPPAPE